MAGVSVHVHAAAMTVTPFDEAEMKATRMKRRVYDILNKATQKPADRFACDMSVLLHIRSFFVHFALQLQ